MLFHFNFARFRDAEDAVRGRDGYEIGRSRIRVEFPKQERDFRSGGGFWGGRGRGGFGGRGRGRGAGPPRRSDYRVLVSGLPQTGSWQDLKDHMREAGDVVYTDVFRDGTGVVEFARKDDMKWAVKNLNDSKFKSHEVCSFRCFDSVNQPLSSKNLLDCSCPVFKQSRPCFSQQFGCLSVA